MSEILRKLTSRKFIMALVGVVIGLAIVFGVETSDISTVAGAVTALASAVSYIMAEAKVDAESVKKAVEATQKAVDAVEGAE